MIVFSSDDCCFNCCGNDLPFPQPREKLGDENKKIGSEPKEIEPEIPRSAGSEGGLVCGQKEVQ